MAWAGAALNITLAPILEAIFAAAKIVTRGVSSAITRTSNRLIDFRDFSTSMQVRQKLAPLVTEMIFCFMRINLN